VKATYTGPAGRYYVRDAAGKRVYLPRGEPVELPASLPADTLARLRRHPQIRIEGASGAGKGDDK